MPNGLEQLRAAGTVLIADTANFEEIAHFHASEGTTNPTLLYLAATTENSAYAALVAKAVDYARTALPENTSRAEQLSAAVDYLAVQFGAQICQQTGRVSTEVDATLSFDTAATVAGALRIIALYAAAGVAKQQVRIKISATWEGIEAARVLQRDHGVSCLATVVFGLAQAVAAAEAGIDAIAPYVGRIADWGSCHGYEQGDFGVVTVAAIQNQLRKYGFRTQVMAASFRSTAQVTALAGIDLLTASPAILRAVEAETETVTPQLTRETAAASDLPDLRFHGNEAAFRWAFNADACAVEKSAEAMRRFAADTDKLKDVLDSLL